MKKIILINGLIAGALVSLMLLITQYIFRANDTTLDYGMLIGFSTMIISLSLIFVAVKTYRDRHQNGVITFGKAFQIGILLAVIASFMYATTWEIYFNTAGSDFVAWYTKAQMDKLVQEGASEAELTEMKTSLDSMATIYQNPLMRFSMTLMEIFPVGLIITLISAGLLRKKEVLPA
ncbi:DUF4199 domain-containing protein [Chryseotalea sanaruensis]|uniref:DUF4199 domain-containing protein n=1 Tax=Chryseotalea sanaruensis TaxID=2482724 RepID=A0A401UD90_9BACT|nr:DUF4199 domain-containing protein [Chryseotalea sanaruensis]GCC52843.1 DUF4199 domain-containing protein [Chryseotalea sanaruensis]